MKIVLCSNAPLGRLVNRTELRDILLVAQLTQPIFQFSRDHLSFGAKSDTFVKISLQVHIFNHWKQSTHTATLILNP